MRTGILLGLLGLGASAWATPSEQAYDRSVDLTNRLFLYQDDLDAGEMLFEAGAGVADRLHWLMAGRDGNTLVLRHGDGTSIGEVSVTSLEDLPDALRDVEGMITQSGFPLDDVDVRLQLLTGMTKAFDRYSRILAGDGLERFDTRLKGTLVGVGAHLILEDDQLMVKSVIRGGPAERGGLQARDNILRIDGRSTVNMPVREASRRIRGERDTVVELSVLRGEETLELPFTRDQVVLENVQHKVLEGGIGYIRITHVSQRTVTNLLAALAELGEQGAMTTGLVMDLRGNTGGSMKESARSADEFLTEGMLLRTVGPDGGRVHNLQAQMDAVDDGNEPTLPIVVLMDKRTASGAEIIAGALLQMDRAVLVGTRSYGKGTVQKIYTLDQETRFKLTVAQYLLAGDRVVADVGLVADVTIAPIYLDEYGVRYRGWEYERTQTPWNDIIPFVKEEEGWRGQKPDTPDLVLELARTALLQTESAERDELLAVVRRISEEMRVVEERHLFSAYEHHGVNWTPAPVSVEVPLHAGVDISARPDPRQDVWEVRAQVSNRGTEVISQALIELSCETFSAWDGLVVPVGQVKPGQRVEGTVFVPLVPGVDLRRDEVTATLRADGRQELTLPPQVLDVNSSEVPRIRVNAVLRTEGENRVVQVRLRNLSATPIEGLEAYFEHPGDVDVELIDRAARIPRLGPREAKTLDLAVRLGEDAPEVLPLDLVVETDRYDELVDWPLLVPIDGTEIVVEAPKVVMRRAHPLSAPVGPMDIPFVATDDGQLTFLVAYVNGEKVAWAQGVKGKAEIVATADLHEGRNRIVAIAEDDQGVRSRYDLTIHGEANDVADEGDETP